MKFSTVKTYFGMLGNTFAFYPTFPTKDLVRYMCAVHVSLSIFTQCAYKILRETCVIHCFRLFTPPTFKFLVYITSGQGFCSFSG